jgi:hypothetical protein
MARIRDLLLHSLKESEPLVFFWDNDNHLHCAHVNLAWEAIQASGFKIPYMCSYAVQAGAATDAIIRGLEHYRQVRCTHVGVLDSA